MLVPVKIKTKVSGVTPEDLITAIEVLSVPESLVERIVEKFKDILEEQLKENRTTRGFAGGIFRRSKDSSALVQVDPYSPGAYLSTVRHSLKERNVNGERRMSLVINIGGKGIADDGSVREVLYARMIDRAFGPYTRVVKETERFAGLQVGASARFTTLRPGRVLRYNQPVDTREAWAAAVRVLEEELPKIVEEALPLGKKYSSFVRRNKSVTTIRDARGRFAKI